MIKRRGLLLMIIALLVLPALTLGLTACGTKEVKKEIEVPPPTGPLPSNDSIRQQELARQARELFENVMVHFDFDKYDIRPDAAEILHRKAEYLKANSRVAMEVQGHCDERGTPAYNMALGDRRAHAAKKYLMDLGIDGLRMITVSYGEERPLDIGHNEAAWATNRRVQFILSER